MKMRIRHPGLWIFVAMIIILTPCVMTMIDGVKATAETVEARHQAVRDILNTFSENRTR